MIGVSVQAQTAGGPSWQPGWGPLIQPDPGGRYPIEWYLEFRGETDEVGNALTDRQRPTDAIIIITYIPDGTASTSSSTQALGGAELTTDFAVNSESGRDLFARDLPTLDVPMSVKLPPVHSVSPLGRIDHLPLGFWANTLIQRRATSVNPDSTRGLVSKHREHEMYLKEVSSVGAPPPITPETALLARMAWQTILDAFSTMPVPAACTGPDGEMFYSWDRGRHHLELEIIPGKPSEFFYRDRETEDLWGEDYNVGDPLSAEALTKLRLFI